MQVKQVLFFLLVFIITFFSCEKEKPSQDESTKWEVYTTKDGLLSNLVNCITEDSSGTIWAGTNRGLCSFNSPAWSLVLSSDLECHSLSSSADGIIAGTNYGIGIIKDDSWYFIQEGFNIAEVEYVNNNYWFTASNNFNNLYSSNGQKLELLAYGPMGDIYQLKSGVVFICSPGFGIYLFNQKSNYLTNITSMDGLSSDWCYTIYQNSFDKIWVGTDSQNGLCEILDDTIICYDFPYIKAIDEDKKGNLWLGSSLFGVYKWETNGNRINYTMLDGLPSNRITDLLVAQDGSVWVSTEDAGVARYQPQRGKQ